MKIDSVYKWPAVMVLAGIFLSSCAKLPIVQSQWHEEAMGAEKNFSHYDSKSDLRYMISNDDTHLYVSFDTDDRGTLINLMMSGARIYVDTNGKKKGTAYLKYPLIDRQSRQERPGTSMSRDPREQADRPAGFSGQGDRRMPTKAVFVSGGEQFVFDTKLDETGFEVVMIPDSLGTVYCMVGIPFDEIHPEGKAGLQNLAVGIEIEAFSPSLQMGPPSEGGLRGSGGGRSGGGMPGGGSDRGGSRPGGSSNQGGMPASSNPVKIWVNVMLSEGSPG